MKDYIAAAPPPPFDYPAFIGELRLLLDEAVSSQTEKWNRDAIEFRVWKARLIELLGRVERLGYQVRCGVKHRLFQTNGISNTNTQAFRSDLQETAIELKVMLESYDKYGDPHPPPPPSAPTASMPAQHKPLLPPEKVTFRWLHDHVPAMFVVAAIGLLFTTFTAGITLGMTAAGTKAGKEFLAWVLPEPK